MQSSKRKIKSEEIFDSIVRNAIDFLEHSIAELDTDPKYSIIHFCSAVELFLKARLMLEHWNLIFEEPRRANLTSFLQGDFKSVGMEETINRLQRIADLTITKDEENCFNTIRNHRNELIHFFNEAYTDGANTKEIETVALEECKGWFYISQLLTEKWKSEFSAYATDIARLDSLMLGTRKYLRAKFDALQSDIEIKKKRGAVFNVCRSCGFESSEEEIIAEVSETKDRLLAFGCLVCNARSRSQELHVSCPSCEDSTVRIQDLGSGECDDCEYTVSLSELLDRYAMPPHPNTGKYEPERAYCNFCEYLDEPTVVEFGDIWLCMGCLEIHEQVGSCGYCGEFVSGNIGDSFLSGCLMCEGQMGHYMNSRAYRDD